MNDLQPFAASVTAYFQAGWPCILPVPPGTKYPPPVGYTGAEGADTDPVTLATWAAGQHAGDSVALRLPDGVIGIDVDQYLKKGVQKNGAATLASHLEAWGPLPATWTSTSREPDGPSRIYFFRVPPQRYATGLAGGDVDVIQRHHRYVVVAPSINPETGQAYRWFSPDGEPSDRVPSPDELPELPSTWVTGLLEAATAASLPSSDPASGWALLEQLREDTRPECVEVTNARTVALQMVHAAEAGSRHDTMTARVHHLIQIGAQGHHGVGHALLELSITWDQLTAGENRGREFEDMLLTSARKAVTAVGLVQVVADPCSFSQAFMVSGPAPEDADGNPVQAIEPDRWWSVLQVIGTHTFDPTAQLDQPLAQAVLERTWPVTRFAYDSKGWLLRVPGRWELHGDLTPWAVAQVAPLMPIGDPTAEKGSDEHARSSRRARLMTQAGAKAIANKMAALVSGGTHPCSIRLADLDREPDLLWAGGLAFDLRKCLPTNPIETWVAEPSVMDPATPHLHSAAVLPETRPTPLWDAFLEAVWPDPEIRAWAVRVLAISLTGYADRALPILLGETGRGKTQVLSLIMSVLGTYAHAADPRLLSPAGERAHSSIVFALKGRRLSFIDEGPKEGRFAQERLKQLTGGGELTANQMNHNPISFRPTHTLVLTANPEQEPVLTDPAVRARARLIPCDGDPELVRVTRAAIGHPNSTAWRTEAPGVLAKLMAEAGLWLEDPTSALTVAAPESIRYLAETVGAEQDPVLVWLEEETEYLEAGTPSQELYGAFVSSCRRSNLRADAIPTTTRWGKTLTRLGYPAAHSRQGKVRPLRVRQPGFWAPGTNPVPAISAHPPIPAPPAGPSPIRGVGDGLPPVGDGLVTGSNPNPSQVNPQVNLPFSQSGDGLTGSTVGTPYMRAPAQAHEAAMQNEPQPVTETPDETLFSQVTPPIVVTGEPVTPPKPAKKRAAPDPEKAAASAEKRALASAEKRTAAIVAASGRLLELPAVLTRAGTVSSIDVAGADTLLETITNPEAGQALTVDVEHTGYPIGHNLYALRTVQLGNEHFAVVLDHKDDDQAAVIRRHLERAPHLHAHSATADLIPLSHAGLLDAGLDHAWARMLDTGVAAKLIDPGSEAALKQLAPAVLGDNAVSPAADEARAALFKAGKWLTDTEADTPIERSGWAQVDHRSETMIRYDGSDVLDTAALGARLVWPEGEQLVREKTAQRMTARISDVGVRLDPEHVAELRGAQTAAKTEAGDRLRAFGVENPGSDIQVATKAEELGAQLPRTPSGRASVAEGVLDPMRNLEGDLGDFIRARLDFQKAKTRLSLILEPYHQLVTNGDGRARPTVLTLGAKTGRMSCARPNLQQVPREGGFRACITADPGHVLISADFASVEIRVAAALSQDPNLITMLEQGVDLHWEAARQVFGPQATKSDRYDVKRGVFGWLYGGQAPTLAKQMRVTEPTAQALIDTLAHLLPGVTYWRELTREGIRSGRTQFPTYAGRVVHMPVKAPHAAPNYCIQGSARELLIDGLLEWEKTRWGGAVLLPVHDEIVVMVPEDDAEEATAGLVECMSSELYGLEIKVEASAPTFAWADAA